MSKEDYFKLWDQVQESINTTTNPHHIPNKITDALTTLSKYHFQPHGGNSNTALTLCYDLIAWINENKHIKLSDWVTFKKNHLTRLNGLLTIGLSDSVGLIEIQP